MVTVSKGKAFTNSVCSTSGCALLTVTGAHLKATTTYTIKYYSNVGDSTPWATETVTTDVNGTFIVTDYVFGYSGSQVWASATNGSTTITSSKLTW